jgi:hypothetical protein
MLDWFHCGRTLEHVDAAVQGLRDAPGRSILCYGAGWGTAAPVDDEVRRVRSSLTDSGPVTLAAELGLRTSVHIETGGRRRPIADPHEHRLLSSTTTYVHANGVSDDELHILADAGGSVSISPDVETQDGNRLADDGPRAGRRPASVAVHR